MQVTMRGFYGTRHPGSLIPIAYIASLHGSLIRLGSLRLLTPHPLISHSSGACAPSVPPGAISDIYYSSVLDNIISRPPGAYLEGGRTGARPPKRGKH